MKQRINKKINRSNNIENKMLENIIGGFVAQTIIAILWIGVWVNQASLSLVR